MLRTIARCVCVGSIAAALLLGGCAAPPDDNWTAGAAECLTTANGVNEGREWAQYRITPNDVRVLVQSGAEDWVFVELVCRHGDLAEGARHKLPDRIAGNGEHPATMLARSNVSTEQLQRLAERARKLAGLQRAAVSELDVSYVNEPAPRTVYRAVLSQDGTQHIVEFDDNAAIEGELTLRSEELSDAPEPEAPGTALGLERLTDDPIKVMDYLAGEIGKSTRINRLVLDPRMLTVEWVAPDKGNVLLNQWSIVEDKISAPNEPTPPNQDKVCSGQPTVEAVQQSLARAMTQAARAQRIRQAALLLLECEKTGAAPAWNLLGGDGKIQEGVALSRERFAF